MNIEELRNHCIAKPEVTESFPFYSGELRINLKCNPQKAIELREKYPAVLPGYHMNKQHWNGVDLNGSLPNSQIEEWIDHSYNMAVKGLKKAEREGLTGHKS